MSLLLEKIYERLLDLYEKYSPNEWLWLISYSGGKDSTTLLLLTLKLANEKFFKVGVIYHDSGGDIPDVKNLVSETLSYVKKLSHEVYISRPEKSFFDYLLTKYSPPRWNFRWCCKRLKELPFKNFISKLIESNKVLNLVGNRGEEARWRKWFIKKFKENLIYVAPLYDLKNHEVWQLLEEISKELNMMWTYWRLQKIYERGLIKRTGCWFCPLIVSDEMLLADSKLLKLKMEIYESWCNGKRNHILELSKKYPELIKTSVNNISIGYPCGRRCEICQVQLVRKILRNLVNY
jgi:3'-phosphoadenosine 5'-phosphosulfate sulfotransferase (PAPS reductase)/FAD synthetase